MYYLGWVWGTVGGPFVLEVLEIHQFHAYLMVYRVGFAPANEWR